MPLFSSFTPFGSLEYSSDPSLVEKFYDANIANLNTHPDENFDIHPGTNIDAQIYARSRVQAAAVYTLRRAYNNASPGGATETLPLLESEFQVLPGPQDSIPDRRAVLAARALLPLGATFINITNALTALLGTGFKYYRVTTAAEAVNYPTNGGDQPGNFTLPSTVIKNYRLTYGVSIGLGSPQTVIYLATALGTPPLLNGDKLVIEPEIFGQTESVEVSSTTATTFVATFDKSHEPNCYVTTTPYPFWISTQRKAFIIVTRAVAEDAEKRRRIHELMNRMARGVSTWDILPDDGSGTATSVYTIGNAITGRVGYAPIAVVTYP